MAYNVIIEYYMYVYVSWLENSANQLLATLHSISSLPFHVRGNNKLKIQSDVYEMCMLNLCFIEKKTSLKLNFMKTLSCNHIICKPQTHAHHSHHSISEMKEKLIIIMKHDIYIVIHPDIKNNSCNNFCANFDMRIILNFKALISFTIYAFL